LARLAGLGNGTARLPDSLTGRLLLPFANLSGALDRWRAVLGAEHVIVDAAPLAQAESATFATRNRIPAILRPRDRAQIQDCLRTASECGVPLYPISSGKNWGYGSRVPPADGCALLDLSRLTRILKVNEELGYVTLEPGVTQQQLYAYLRQRGSRLWIDATGSSPDCSVIGNVMERGFGHTPYGDHFAQVCGLEIVLPTGEIIETGSARFPGAASAAVTRWGVGPSLDGLFSQSNFGVVTRMTVWLMPQPECFEAFFYRCEDPAGLPALIDALRELRLQEILRSSIHIGNDYKVLNGLQQYPWDETGGRTPLSPEQMARFRNDLTFGYWNASGGLYGTPAQVAEAKRQLRRALSKQRGKLRFLSEQKLELARRFAKAFSLLTRWDVTRTIEIVQPVVGLMRGVPTRHALASAYWRKRMPIPADPDPDRDRCGLLWYAPVAPASGKEVAGLTDLASATLLRSGFEPMISLTMLTRRSVYAVLSITYDRDVPGEDERAMNCYRELADRCAEAGYYPYRLGIQSMCESARDAHYASVVARLKAALDPNAILAPGRYEELPASAAEIQNRSYAT
jgi:4-cresol dehydrogenase (hydroxylating) flavoprotein subunit